MFIKVVKVFQLSTSVILKVCNNKEIKKEQSSTYLLMKII